MDEIKRLKELAGLLNESAPSGWEGTVKAMKHHPEIDNPYALANYMKNKGDTSHINEAGHKVAYQDGSDFYDTVSGEHICSYPELVHGDYDTEGATNASNLFLKNYPEYRLEGTDIDETIEKVGSEYELKSHTGKNLGKYPTKAGAEKRERQVNYFKHMKENLLNRPVPAVSPEEEKWGRDEFDKLVASLIDPEEALQHVIEKAELLGMTPEQINGIEQHIISLNPDKLTAEIEIGNIDPYGNNVSDNEFNEAIELGNPEDVQCHWFIVDQMNNVLDGPYNDRSEAAYNTKFKQWFNPAEHSIEYGIDDNGTFVEEQPLDEALPDNAMAALRKAKENIPRPQSSSGSDDEWLDLLRKRAGIESKVPSVVHAPAKEPEVVSEPESFQTLKTRKENLDKLIDVKHQLEVLQAKAGQWGTLPPGLSADLDDSHYGTGEEDNFEAMLAKNEDALKKLSNYIKMKQNLYRKPMREEDMLDNDKAGVEELMAEDEQEVVMTLNNGYDEEEYLDGEDYFPNGADTSVVKKVGPSGARQADNPEQKQMQIAETLNELVNNYRKFLKS